MITVNSLNAVYMVNNLLEKIIQFYVHVHYMSSLVRLSVCCLSVICNKN